MNSAIQSVLLFFYAGLNKLACFEKPWAQKFFTSFYFSYKRLFESGFSALIRRYPTLFENGNIIDVGANIGYTSTLFARALTFPYKVYAFEPEERNFRMFGETLKKEGLQDRVVAYCTAVGARKATDYLWINKTNSADHRVMTPEFRARVKPEGDTRPIEMVSLDDVLNAGGKSLPVSFIKIDVQGYEWPVCQGMTMTLEKNPRAIVVIEYCPTLLKLLGFDPRNVLDFFLSRGYSPYQISHSKGLAVIDLKPLLEGKRTAYYIDLLFSKRSLL